MTCIGRLNIELNRVDPVLNYVPYVIEPNHPASDWPEKPDTEVDPGDVRLHSPTVCIDVATKVESFEVKAYLTVSSLNKPIEALGLPSWERATEAEDPACVRAISYSWSG